ncbi:MAG: type II toxin-antitoxin system RelE/ParE family toxin [Gammaproteobacteria bacterium]|nr:type II toxin-antitoxin system RelE/ParE family toxin [Gammaproteobacteria bacterium]
MKLIWLPSAVQDLTTTVDYLRERADPSTVNRFARRIHAVATQLEEMPYMGHVTPEDDRFREFHIPGSTINLIYRVFEQEGEIQLRSVFDTRRLRFDDWD